MCSGTSSRKMAPSICMFLTLLAEHQRLDHFLLNVILIISTFVLVGKILEMSMIYSAKIKSG